jgi:putative effector of murein hydrolase
LKITIASPLGKRVAEEFMRLSAEKGLSKGGATGNSDHATATTATSSIAAGEDDAAALSLRITGATPEQALAQIALLGEILARRV